jgi:hypothetical protein
MRVGRNTCSQGTDYKREESTKRRVSCDKIPTTQGYSLGPCPLRGRSCPQANTQKKGDENRNSAQKGGSEGIGYMFQLFLLKSYLRFSTGSQE